MPKATLPLNEADRLATLYDYNALDTATDDAIDNLVRLAARLTGCPTAVVSITDSQRQWFKARHGLDAAETPRDTAFSAHAILSPGHALVIEDAAADPRFADNPLVTGAPGIRFYAGVPLVAGNDHALGTLCVIDYVPRVLPPDDLDTLRQLARAVMTTLDLRRATQQARGMAQAMGERFASMVEALPAAILLTTGDGLIRLVNRQAERVFGYGRAELEGASLELLLPENLRPTHAGLRDSFARAKSYRMMGEGRALFGRHKDGSAFPLEIGLSPIEFDGEPMALAVIADVARRHQLEIERQLHRRELERSNAELQEFAYAASHDLKAPLRAIGHLAEWISQDVAPVADPGTLENLALLQGRVARLQTLLDGLLAYSRIDRADTGPEAVDVADMVRDVTAMLEVKPGFSVVTESAVPVIQAHRAPVQAVLKNLIGNALQHHDRDTGRVTVSLRMLPGDEAEFRVTDDGPGIPPRYHDRIFVIFQTLDSRDDRVSSGIGLALAKKKIEYNGGTIRVESDPPARGSCFIFTWKTNPSCRTEP